MESARMRRLALAVPIGIAVIVVMLVVPIPSQLLDILITANITFALVVLGVSLRVTDPLEFAAFPSVLLIATMFRLALNVSATRLVLLHAFAGSVIESFGHFVVGGSVVVGLVVFAILFIIQFVVITSGAGRVAEVGARFTLDAMPGKQMAIDADLNAGHIDEAEARRRRSRISKEADFYGAMDGASKFIKGDAIAAAVITVINLIGGFIVGVVQHHLSVTQSIDTYSLLSVGDGLVSQIPALLLSIATGLVVTRTSNDADFGLDLLQQLLRQSVALQIAGGIIGTLGLLPGLPKLPFLLVGGVVFFIGWRVSKKPEQPQETADELTQVAAPETAQDVVGVEILELELGFELLDVVDPTKGGDLLERVKGLRRKLAGELGFVLPPVRTHDNLDIGPTEYVIKIAETEFSRGKVPRDRVLAIGDNLDALPGEETIDPVFGLRARWIPPDCKTQAQVLGATVVDRSSVIVTHLSEVVQHNAGSLLTRQQTKEMLDALKRVAPVVVDELNSAQVAMGDIQRVLRELLDERVPVRNLPAIVEAIVDRYRTSKESDALLDAAREALGGAISSTFAQDGMLAVVYLSSQIEMRFAESLVTVDGRRVLGIGMEEIVHLREEIRAAKLRAEIEGHEPVLVCMPAIRRALFQTLRAGDTSIPVLAVRELAPSLKLIQIGVIGDVQPATV
ncbi:flagellar biosynthesis protein FlhA [Ferrimicrobium acidiphilum]|uniref:Flagellar biosynthesis protein FlhA n=1 Tax=Ferrimicrobium acidiphilum DSM 19497 TaxID=1121877 RepID=A0A0D8FWG5_9ACTN|nr:flagellar biosynthesis protein FlhA [Ferrimicrobium acidiphilum]KJE76602.1 flagellar biosynthesis protein FlhA [Ferrimicrobium acidiphilum DSM 19497]